MKLVGIIIAFASLLISCNVLDPNENGNLVAKTVDEDSAIPYIELTSTKLHCQSYGNTDSTTIFILEGGPGDDFRYLLKLKETTVSGWNILEHYQIVFHDYRGCGLSRRHPLKELTIANSLKDFEELVDHFALNKKILLLGHSHGGFVACQYLNTHPDRVKGAIFIEPGAFSSEINKHAPAVNSVDYFGQDINSILWIKQLVGMDNHIKADYLYAIGLANRDNSSRGQSCPSLNYRSGAASALAIAVCEVYNSVYDYTSNLGNFSQNVLFISSEQTTDIGYDFQQTYQVPLFQNADHIKIWGTGHSGLINCKTEETLINIKRYLDSLQ